MNKATHTGECQWCSSIQKLPKGYLAKHGYNVTHGFFNGVCPGSGHESYQRSCQLVKDSIPKIEQQIQVIEKQIEDIRGWQGTKGYFRVYGRRTGQYFWDTVEFLPDGRSFVFRGETVGNNCLAHYSAEENAKYYNGKYCEHLEQCIKQLERFKQTQIKRVNDWKLSDEFPIQEAESVACKH